MRVRGIDLGTTNSLIAVFDDRAPRLIPDALDNMLTPSAVGVDDAGTVLRSLKAGAGQHLGAPINAASAFGVFFLFMVLFLIWSRGR